MALCVSLRDCHLDEDRLSVAAPAHAVQHHAVRVDVEVGGRALPSQARLDQRDRAAVGLVGLEAPLPEQVARDHAVHHLQHGRHQPGLSGQPAKRSGIGSASTHCRAGTCGMAWSTRCAAVCSMRRAPHGGQKLRRLQEKATGLSCPQSPRCGRYAERRRAGDSGRAPRRRRRTAAGRRLQGEARGWVNGGRQSSALRSACLVFALVPATQGPVQHTPQSGGHTKAGAQETTVTRSKA